MIMVLDDGANSIHRCRPKGIVLALAAPDSAFQILKSHAANFILERLRPFTNEVFLTRRRSHLFRKSPHGTESVPQMPGEDQADQGGMFW